MRQSFLILTVLFTLLACNKPKYYAPGITNKVVNSFYFSGKFNDSNVYQNVSWYYEGTENRDLNNSSKELWQQILFFKDATGTALGFHPEGNKYYYLNALELEFNINMSIPNLRKNLGKMYKLDSSFFGEMSMRKFNLATKRGNDFYQLRRSITDSIQCLELKDTVANGYKYGIYTFRFPKLLFVGDFLVPIEVKEFRFRYFFRSDG